MGADRLKAAGILAVLALPLPLMAAVYLVPLDKAQWLGYSGAGFGLLAIGAIVAATGMRPAQVQVTQQAGERFGTTLAAGFGLGVSSTELLLADVSVPLALVVLVLAAAWTLAWLPSRMRRIVAQTTVEIHRDAATVFAYVSDFRNLVQWFPGYLSVEKTTPGPIGVGTRFHGRVQLSSGVAEGDDDLVEFEPSRRVASQVPGSRGVGIDTFEPSGSGTVVTHRFEGIIGYGLALVGGARRRSATAQAILGHDQAAFARLKQVLEAGALQTSPPGS